jgi:hypothetical protein
VNAQVKHLIVRYLVIGVIFMFAVIGGVALSLYEAEPGSVVEVGPERGMVPARLPSPADVQPDAGPPQFDAPYFVDVDGARRVSCAGACAREAVCGLRPLHVCQRGCQGDLRVEAASDLLLPSASDCAAMAAAPCADACARRAGCGESGSGCVELCLAQAARTPKASYARSRCAIEAADCPAVAACAPAP